MSNWHNDIGGNNNNNNNSNPHNRTESGAEDDRSLGVHQTNPRHYEVSSSEYELTTAPERPFYQQTGSYYTSGKRNH